MFCVVETLEDSVLKCTAVPQCWVINNKTLLWPNSTKELKCRKNNISPKDDWERIDCTVIYKNIGILCNTEKIYKLKK